MTESMASRYVLKGTSIDTSTGRAKRRFSLENKKTFNTLLGNHYKWVKPTN